VECLLLLAATGRDSADAANVWQHAAENYDAAGASGIGVPRARQTLAAWSRDGDVSAESTGNTISGGLHAARRAARGRFGVSSPPPSKLDETLAEWVSLI
jgi:hypothetical protein